jgi:co-chaperonin GroES (HSP10)
MGQGKVKGMSGIIHPYSKQEMESPKTPVMLNNGENNSKNDHIVEKRANNDINSPYVKASYKTEEISDLCAKRFEYSGANDDVYEKERKVEEYLGFECPKVTGYHLAIKVHYNKNDIKPFKYASGRESVIFVPPTKCIDNDEYRSPVGLVVGKGPWAYKGERFEDKSWCDVGDYVVFKRNEGHTVDYRGMKMVYVADDRVHGTLADPDWVTRDPHITDLAKKNFSYIENYEEEEAKKLIREHLGFEPPVAAGWQIVVKIYIREDNCIKYKKDDGTESLIVMPPTSRSITEEKFTSRVGLVLSVGPQAYKDKKFGGVPWCKVGDWIVMPRHGKTHINYRGVQVLYLDDDMVLQPIRDPEHVTIH